MLHPLAAVALPLAAATATHPTAVATHTALQLQAAVTHSSTTPTHTRRLVAAVRQQCSSSTAAAGQVRASVTRVTAATRGSGPTSAAVKAAVGQVHWPNSKPFAPQLRLHPSQRPSSPRVTITLFWLSSRGVAAAAAVGGAVGSLVAMGRPFTGTSSPRTAALTATPPTNPTTTWQSSAVGQVHWLGQACTQCTSSKCSRCRTCSSSSSSSSSRRPRPLARMS